MPETFINPLARLFSQWLPHIVACLLLQAGSPVVAGPDTVLTAAQVARMLNEDAHVLMMRHAQTVPGFGDPPEFNLGDCSTQRNLSEGGRQQARRIGAALRDAGITPGIVRYSQWCRCRETAQLAFTDPEPTAWPVINSFFQDRSTEPAQTAALYEQSRRWAQQNITAFLVTHQVNISAALGTFSRQGEVLVARFEQDRLVPVGRLQFQPVPR